MSPLAPTHPEPDATLARAITNDRVHSGYLLTGDPLATRAAALGFLRALVCENPIGGAAGQACGACLGCRQTGSAESDAAPTVAIDGKGKRGPYYRHLGDHASLFWVARGEDDTRITVGQIRELSSALRLRGFGGDRRAALIEGAESMNASAQNALLRILEEPPARTTFVLTATRPSAVLATIRSRSVRIRFPDAAGLDLRGPEAPPETRERVALLDSLRSRSVPELLDAAEAYRGGRAEAAEAVVGLIDVAVAWLHARVTERVAAGERPSTRELDACKSLQRLRRELETRNANPQMVAERLLFGLRDAVA